MKTNKIFKIVFSVVAILTIGLFAGYNPSHGRHSTTQNYLIAAASEASSATLQVPMPQVLTLQVPMLQVLTLRVPMRV